MKKELRSDSKTRGPIFGAPLQTLAAEELDRVFGGQAGPPAPSPTPPSTPTSPGSGPYPYPYKGTRGYDLYGQEN